MTSPLSISTKTIRPDRPLRFKFLGVGGAGGCLVEYLAHTNGGDFDWIALNSDERALARCQVAQKYQLGASEIYGAGLGGNAELGRTMAEKEFADLKRLCVETDVVFVAAGLGRGTGTGVAPVVARAARESGAFVLALAFMPFDFEGAERQRQAQDGLQQLQTVAHGVISLPNQRLMKLVTEKTSVVAAFRLSHALLAQGLHGLWRLLTRPGILQLDLGHLREVLCDNRAASALAAASASGPDRARQVAETLLASPWLDEGQVLNQSSTFLVSVAGGPDLSLAEISHLVEPFSRRCAHADLLVGATVDEILADRLEVVLITSDRSAKTAKPTFPSAQEMPAVSAKPPLGEGELDTQFLDHPSPVRPPARYLPPPPELSPEQTEQWLKQQKGAHSRLRKVLPRLRQGQLPLEIVSKGRFDKSEPTIHQGEDLDVPTFKRRGLVLN